MLLTDKEILRAIKDKDIIIDPFNVDYLGPDSLDLTLGNEILVSKNKEKIIDPKNIEDFFEKVIFDDYFILKPGQFILGTTYEKIGLSNKISAQIEGRSTLGRLGIMVHMTAGIIHAGFGAKKPNALTLEIYSVNPNPVKLYKNMKIAQLSFFKLNEEVNKGYDFIENSKYKYQSSVLKPKND